jgi:hypothetical protein
MWHRLKSRVRFDVPLVVIFAIGVLLRTTYDVIAPLSPDWHNWYNLAIYVYYNPGYLRGIYTLPPYILAGSYALWASLPITHLDPNSLVWNPYFRLTLNQIIFVFFLKLPALIADTVIALLICKLLESAHTSKNTVRFAVGAWLLNPLTMIMSNYNSVDPIPAMLVLVSAYLIEKDRYGWASISLTLSALMRLLPLIVFPFILLKKLRAKEWRGLFFASVPVGLSMIVALTWLALYRPDVLVSMFQTRPGLYVPEALDVFGSAIQRQGTEFPGNTITLTTLAYTILLALVSSPSRKVYGIGTLVFAPLLAYATFSWSWPPLILYMMPLAIVNLAVRRGYKTLTVLLTIFTFLWSIVQEGTYLCYENVYLFFIPLYNTMLQQLNTDCLTMYWIIYDGGLSIVIRGALSALLLFLAIRLVEYGFGKPEILSSKDLPTDTSASEFVKM